jgi:hypothetical protein
MIKRYRLFLRIFYLGKIVIRRQIKERHRPMCTLSVGGSFVRGGKHYFSGVKRNASPKLDRKKPNSPIDKTNTARRKTVKRQTAFKSDDWYEKAVLSFAISAKS